MVAGRVKWTKLLWTKVRYYQRVEFQNTSTVAHFGSRKFGSLHATLCERLSYFSYQGKSKHSFIIRDSNIFYFYSLPCLVDYLPLIRKRTEEKNRSIAFNMYIFLFIHACDAFSFVSVSRISHTKVRVKVVSYFVTRIFFISILYHA
jgi:hypothetical protein